MLKEYKNSRKQAGMPCTNSHVCPDMQKSPAQHPDFSE